MFLSDVGAQLLPVASDIYRTYTLGAVVMVITRGQEVQKQIDIRCSQLLVHDNYVCYLACDRVAHGTSVRPFR